MITTGIDVGSSSVKCVAVESGAVENGALESRTVENAAVESRAVESRAVESGAGTPRLLGERCERIRRRDPASVVEEAYEALLHESGLTRGDVAYVATTGEGDWIPFRTGHFFGMTTHARGGLFLCPEARGVLDVGALHARAILMDERSRVLGHRMTSQCASGSGQFLENIARYLGVGLEEVGELSLAATAPEKVSSICAVLSETDVINMVSRGIRREDILKGIHLSMGERYARLLRSAGVEGVAMVTGGLASDVGLVATIREELAKQGTTVDLRTHPLSVHAGAIGAALWGAYRHEKLARERARLAATA